MAQFSRIDTALTMNRTGIVPVFYHKDPEVCINILNACYEGGLKVFEFTNRGDFAQENFSQLVKYAIAKLPGMIVGAGSIIDPATAAIYIQNGANFIVSPVLNEDMARVCNRRKILWAPGCGSLSEISKAEEIGAEIVKIFPAEEIGGASFVRNIKGPMPWTNIMPTGGVEPDYDNLYNWFSAGVWCVGLGSKLFPKNEVESKKFSQITSRISETLAMVKKIRDELSK
jgi:2-dehydro-3-deoxyphosphogluconate aldolase / (4S)-4-hydroxy-2-oxoglutarate aldolase